MSGARVRKPLPCSICDQRLKYVEARTQQLLSDLKAYRLVARSAVRMLNRCAMSKASR